MHRQLETGRFQKTHQRRQSRLATVTLVGRHMVLATPARSASSASSDWLRPDTTGNSPEGASCASRGGPGTRAPVPGSGPASGLASGLASGE
jgi:hypothetical protein